MKMYRATTPTFTFTLPSDTSAYEDIQVTFIQGETSLVKEYADGVLPSGMVFDGCDVNIRFTQAETLMFNAGKGIKAQIRVKDENGNVMASDIYSVSVKSSLNEGIIE